MNNPTLARGVRPELVHRLCFMLLVVAAAFGTARAQSFSLPIARNVGSNPNTAAAGDFNGDGKPDVAVGNRQGGSVTIALGNGDGTFSSSIEYNSDLGPEGVAVGDFNKDGKLDVAVANFTGGPLNKGSVSVLFGNGDGTFQTAVNYNAEGSPIRLVAADLNSDGNLDLVTASINSNKATVLLGNANGTFNAAVGYAVGTNPQDVAVADFNNDGKLDLATPDTGSASISILIGNGDGTFQAATSVPLAFPLNVPYSIAAGDLNGDGKIDLVFPSPRGAVGVLVGNGDGTFQTAVSYPTTTGEAVNARLGEFNGDGKLDVAVINAGATGSVGVLRGNGDGTLQAIINFPTQNNPWGLVVADFNLDGKSDLLTTNNGINRINVLLNSPSARGASFSANVGVQLNGVKVASFIDYDTTKTASSFTANINWGDGTAPSAGTVAANGGGGFDVTGSHTYAAAGVYTVTVQIADTNGNFANATATATVTKQDQTISFDAIPDKTFGDADFTINATASSGLNVSFGAMGSCTVTGNTVHITGAGSCRITATQLGDATYNGAPAVSRDFNIAQASTSVAVSSSANPSAVGQSVTFTATVTSPAGFVPSGILGTVNFFDGGNAIPNCASLVSASGQATCTTSALSAGRHVITAEYATTSPNFTGSNGTLQGGQLVGSLFEFSQSSYTVAEGASLTVTVTRTGDTTQAASVGYSTDDGSASGVVVPCASVTGLALDRCDYTKALGTLNFAAGETSKTLRILVGDDSYVEGPEIAHIRLSGTSSTGGLGTNSSATFTITDDSPESAGNTIDNTEEFVRQHYRDFLNRAPDASGLAFWKNEIDKCGDDAQCREVKRINVSAAFFKSIEFQETGYLVERTYKTAFGDTTSPGVAGTVPVIRLDEFLPDTQRIGRDFIVGEGAWEQQLEANKVAYFEEFVSRARFANGLPNSLTPSQFVDALSGNAGITLTASRRQAAIDEFGGSSGTGNNVARARALRRVAEDPALDQLERNRAFVLMEYFGYLRRNPDDAPQTGLNYSGWKFWLDKLNSFNGDFVKAEMVKAFLASDEYRKRFGQ